MQVLPLEDMLRSAWNSKNYMSASAQSENAQGKKRQPFLIEESSKATVGNISELMGSDYAWSCISMISHLASESDKLGVWAEQCPCPEHARVGPRMDKQPGRKRRNQQPVGAAACSLKCCRAPELATGAAMKLQAASLEKRVWEFTASISRTPPQKRAELLGSFQKAIGRLWGPFDKFRTTGNQLNVLSHMFYTFVTGLLPF